MVPMTSCKAWFPSCKAAISPEHPQVGDGEGNGAGAAAVVPTLSSTQKATSHLSRRVTFNLVSAACFCCERLSVLVVRTSIVCAWSWSWSRSAVGAGQVSEGLTQSTSQSLGSMHWKDAGRARVCTRVGVTWRDGCAAVAAWALDYRSQAVHGWRAWRLMWVQPWRGRCCGRRWDGRRLVARLGGDADLLHRFYCRAIHHAATPHVGVFQPKANFFFLRLKFIA
eukprot:scaffold98155_cov72-Phaeocystis_antarctica.AAC.1